MAKSQQTWSKKDREEKKQKKKKAKELRKEERKANAVSGDSESMIAYVDEFGNISSTPPDPLKKTNISAENIEVSVPKKESLNVVDIIRFGTVTYFNASKGYGFIKDHNTQESFFTHINEHIDELKENDRVSFEIEKGKKGYVAVRVKLQR